MLIVAVGRIKQDGGQPVLRGHARPQYALPRATGDAHPRQPIRQCLQVGQEVILPRIAQVWQLPMNPPPRIASVDELAIDDLPRALTATPA